MRQIEILMQFVARLIFKKDRIEYIVHDAGNLLETDLLYYELEKLLTETKICQAEDLLHERIDVGNNKFLELAVDFYRKLNEFSDETLEAANFSREEIYSGLNDIIQIFGLPITFGEQVT